ncbi:MAG: site-2 protease family protein [Desulfuromonadales bacterium]|jgi:Zn-dependent protease
MRDTVQESTTEAPLVPMPATPATCPGAEQLPFGQQTTFPSGEASAQPEKKSFLRRFGALGLLLMFVFGKLKYIPMLLQVGKFKTFITMLISIWAYALFWGWSFAAGFVALLFIHEMGHVIALRMQGIRATAPMFIPFFGAFIGMKQLPDNAFGEAVAAYGGPLLGTLGAMVCALVGVATGNPFWYALASTGFLLNLFNLLPISPLDGGRILGVISPKLWIVGLAGAIGLFWLTWSPIIALIVIMGSLQIWSTAKQGKTEKARYYAVTPVRRIAMGLAFLALAATTSVGMLAVQGPLTDFQERELRRSASVDERE